MDYEKEALAYHRQGRNGKIEVTTTKPCSTQRDLSLAYTPGVAGPCRAIHRNPEDVYQYTAKGNLVAVVSNGSAVLGLGNIGAAAGKPVMEGKGVLFKRFADVDVFDLELDTADPDEIIRTVKLLEPTFGGINLEDIKAPECFYIEEELKKQMNIPVFHDDQHGTAIISGAGLLNALELAGKKIEAVRIVVLGAGAAGIACAKFYMQLGARQENIIFVDSKGVIYSGRQEGMNPYKEAFAVETEARTLAEAVRGADVFIGLSGANLLTGEMLMGMTENPIVFAMSNPDPEISYEEASTARPDAIVATGRSDYPNQINNVLGFPFIFRGALDVRATQINEEMKIAAAQALAKLAHEPVPYSVIKAYRLKNLTFGREYLIPKPFDPRALIWVASAVAKAAMESGVAREHIELETYKEQLENRLGLSRHIMRKFINKAKKSPRRIVYPEGEHDTILKACEIILDEGIAHPILLGRPEVIEKKLRNLNVDILNGVDIIDPRQSPRLESYANTLYEVRQRKGMIRKEAEQLIRDPNYFATVMVKTGDADGMVAGLTQHYADVIRPALQVIGMRRGVRKVAGAYLMILKENTYLFADATVNIDPDSEDLVNIATLCANRAPLFGIDPRIAMLSFSNFGSSRHPLAEKVRQATQLIKERGLDIL
nr:NADP-dependent malic enzyme [Calditrichia bacterium]